MCAPVQGALTNPANKNGSASSGLALPSTLFVSAKNSFAKGAMLSTEGKAVLIYPITLYL